MRNDICNIPISEVFEVNKGCPICRLYGTLNNRMLDYIMGDAMMEPDVRIETNRVGFCGEHFDQMLSHKGRLALALMLQTHLNEVREKKLIQKNHEQKLSQRCFICDKIDWGFSRLIDTLYLTYETDRDFREMFDSQEYFCLPHYELLMKDCGKKKMKRYHREFEKSLSRIANQNLTDLYEKISKYCSMYDYRSDKSGKHFEDCKTAVEESIGFLSGKTLVEFT